MVEYRPEHERMLYSLGLAGSAFKKVYYDPNMGRQVALSISQQKTLSCLTARHTLRPQSVSRISCVRQRMMLKKLQAAGFYSEVELGEPESFHTDIEQKKAEEGGFTLSDDDRYTVYEIHADSCY
jgi:hypothetical protein